MQISAINLHHNGKINTLNKTSAYKPDCKKSCQPLVKPSFKNIKANFLSFGCFKKVGEAYIYNRNTGKRVVATIKKDEIKDAYIMYKIFAGRKELGYMNVTPYSRFPKDLQPLSGQTKLIEHDNFSKIEHLRSIEGKKYSRIGSTLINIAIEESKKANFDGALWLFAQRGFQKLLSPYRSDENPIPFYFKLGFRAIGEDNNKIMRNIENKEYDSLPNSAILVLTSKAANSDNMYLEKNFLFK